MSRFSRRTFLAGSAVAAAPLPAAAQPKTKRNLLTSAWNAEKIATALTPRGRFHPFPTAAEGPGWDALPADARAALIARGEAQLKLPWDVLPASLFLEYKRTGNRSHYEGVRNRRREKLQQIVIAECFENKGRFLDEIANGVWLTCEETFWGYPAHLERTEDPPGLPDVTEPIIDLFAAETSMLLAWTDYLLGPKLGSRIETHPGTDSAGDGSPHPDAGPDKGRFRLDGFPRRARPTIGIRGSARIGWRRRCCWNPTKSAARRRWSRYYGAWTIS